MNPPASGYIFGSPFGRYPTIHTLTSVGRKKFFSMLKEGSRFLSYSEVPYYQQPYNILSLTRICRNGRCGKIFMEVRFISARQSCKVLHDFQGRGMQPGSKLLSYHRLPELHGIETWGRIFHFLGTVSE